MARKKKARKRKAAPKRDELTRLHIAHLRKRYATLKKQLRGHKLSDAQHDKVLSEARSVRTRLERYKGGQ